MNTFVPRPETTNQIASTRNGTADPLIAGGRNAARGRVLILLIASIIAWFCIGMAGAAAIGNSFVIEKGRIEEVLDKIMRAGANRDAAAIYRLISSRAMQGERPWGVEDMLKGNNYALFRGYVKVSLTDLQFTYQPAGDPEYARGLVASASAIVYYEGGYSGTLDAVLEREQNGWKIWAFQVSVSPDKIGNQAHVLRAHELIDTVISRCYTDFACSSGAPACHLSVEGASSVVRTGQPSLVANRLTVGPSAARLAFFIFAQRRRKSILILCKPAQSIVGRADTFSSNPSNNDKRITRGGAPV